MPHFEMVDPDSLRVDPDYQSTVNERVAKLIAENYDDRLVLPIVINRRLDGSGDYIVDGKSRAWAARRLGRKIKALVFRRDRDDEIRLWKAAHRRRGGLDG